MISLKKYLDGNPASELDPGAPQEAAMLPAILAAYGSALVAMGNCSLDACPSLGDDLKRSLAELDSKLALNMSRDAIEDVDRVLQDQLQNWSGRAVRYSSEKAAEVKELLLAMARTAEAVSARDDRSAERMGQVTTELQQIATLDDVTQIRASIQKGVQDLRASIERMKAEGKAAVEALREEVKAYQVRLEEAEELASYDAMTRVRNRMSIENLMEERIETGREFCAAMIDLDGFKGVNDTYGHLVGDEVIKLFAAELRSACRLTDVIGRWGGDEFVLVLDCDLTEAVARVNRLCRWVCGDYTIRIKNRPPLKLRVQASFGLADHRKNESLKALIARADAAMYERKAASRAARKQMPAVNLTLQA